MIWSMICSCLVLLCFVGCPAPQKAEPPTPKTYSLAMSLTPDKVLPERSVAIEVKITDEDGNGAEKGSLALVATLDGADEVKASLSGGEGGVYALKELKFPAVGSWKLAFSLTVGEQTSTFTETVEVSCSGTGESGAACCTSSDCNTGLYCTDGTCGKDKVADNGTCASSEECVSGVCQDGKCQAASCTDQTKNGDEVDVDCGGSCGACGFGQVCSDASDCKGGVCKDGKCGPDPGGLLGAVDGDPQSIKWTTLASLNSNVADLAFHPK
jgi:hypothetical protein